MTTLQLLEKYAKYNLWANQVVTKWLLSKDTDLMTKEVKSSFPTINKTLSHIWVAEQVWMYRIHGAPYGNLLDRHLDKDVEFICHDLLEISASYTDFIGKLSELELLQNISYTLLSGTKGESNILYILHHVMNHSTYHRGQLVTMGRELGFTDPPKTDFMAFV